MFRTWLVWSANVKDAFIFPRNLNTFSQLNKCFLNIGMQVIVAFEGEVTSMFETCPRPHSLTLKVTINYPNTTQEEQRCEIGFSVTSK
jgi:hypothetical protein